VEETRLSDLKTVDMFSWVYAPLQKDLSSAAVTNWEWSPTDAPYPGTEGESSTIATTAAGEGAGAAQDRVAKGTIGKGKG
jgi:hypothetical protein